MCGVSTQLRDFKLDYDYLYKVTCVYTIRYLKSIKFVCTLYPLSELNYRSLRSRKAAVIGRKLCHVHVT